MCWVLSGVSPFFFVGVCVVRECEEVVAFVCLFVAVPLCVARLGRGRGVAEHSGVVGFMMRVVSPFPLVRITCWSTLVASCVWKKSGLHFFSCRREWEGERGQAKQSYPLSQPFMNLPLDGIAMLAIPSPFLSLSQLPTQASV